MQPSLTHLRASINVEVLGDQTPFESIKQLYTSTDISQSLWTRIFIPKKASLVPNLLRNANCASLKCKQILQLWNQVVITELFIRKKALSHTCSVITKDIKVTLVEIVKDLTIMNRWGSSSVAIVKNSFETPYERLICLLINNITQR